MSRTSSKDTTAALTYRYWSNLKRKLQYQITIYGSPTEPSQMHFNRFARARAAGYRSGLEVRISNELKAQGVTAAYEEHVIRYTKPERLSKYTPDFVLPNFIVIETKGRWVTEDRQKVKLVREQHPDIDLRIVFSNSNARISKQSSTTYAMFCEKLGIPYADKSIPESWIREPINLRSKEALEAAISA
jgi:hypothetical protein